ncbi:glycosyltransferase [Agromyces sp. NPDC058484]|uniref:glycosyltransferase n=1 Tax=Agromyces sp. NPDC058484 TaxID=3346524 RepID=UPI00364CB43A
MTGRATSDAESSGSVLPAGRHLAVTWGIPDRYGGMTSALLHRSRAFVRLAGREVDVVTFDTRPDYAEVRERLADAGELVRGIRLRNLYEDLRAVTPEPSPIAHRPGRPGDPGHDELEVTTAADGSGLRVARHDGRPTVVEHVRADGTIAVRDELRRADGPKRLITAFAPGGEPVRQWTTPWACYADWLDGVLGGERAFAITDSKSMAPFMADYRRPNVVTLHVVHNSHLAGADAPYGTLRPSRRSVLAHLERFDGVVFLTARQRDDVATLLSDSGNLAVVANGIDLPAEAGAADAAAPGDRDFDDRDPESGVVVAGLTARKRVDHALDIVRACRAGGVPASLTVYGDGPDAPALRAGAADAGLAGAVAFAGHRPDASRAFEHASWTLLTSTFEGAPLVLAEAMARGCLPIAYDIRYGPGDLIVDGVNGFLVPAGDRTAAADAIARLVALSPERRAAMRRAARETAARHDDDGIVTEWGRALRAAARRHDRGRRPFEASVTRYRLRSRRGRLIVTARLAGVSRDAHVFVTLRRRDRDGALLRARRPARRRLRWRLDTAETAFLGTRHPLIGAIVVEAGASRVELELGTLHPDTRSPMRRLAQRVTGLRRAGAT